MLTMIETYRCPQCKKELPLTSEYFYRDRANKHGFHYECKLCLNKNDRERHYKQHYKIDVKTYNYMFNKYKGCCWICGLHQSNFKRRLSVDHNHKTGKVRGLLCHNCNTLLGKANENLFILIRSIKYLKEDTDG